MKGFDIVESTRDLTTNPTSDGQLSNTGNEQGKNPIRNAIADNFGSILSLAGNVIEIRKMKTASEALLQKMQEDRKTLLAEAEAYVAKKNADTNSVVARMNVIRMMMQDFYAQNDGSISGDAFCKVMTEMVNQLGKLENGIR